MVVNIFHIDTFRGQLGRACQSFFLENLKKFQFYLMMYCQNDTCISNPINEAGKNCKRLEFTVNNNSQEIIPK